MIEPTERTLWWLVVVAVVGALGLAVPVVGAAAPVLAGGLALALLADAWLAGAPRAVSVRRVLPPHVVEGRPAQVGLTLATERALKLTVVSSLPAGALAADAVVDVQHALRLAAREEVSVATTVIFVRRGRHMLGRVTVRTHGPLGLARRRARLPLAQPITVVPDVARLAARAERLLRGQDEGGARRRALREGRELDSLRDYRPGDDPRLVAWKASARRGQLVVKKLRPETRQDVIVAVDAGRQLSGSHAREDGGELRLDVAMTAALLLAAAGLSRGDRVGLLGFASDVLAWRPPLAGRGSLRALAETVNDVRALPEEADYAAVARFVAAKSKRRALVCFVTDVLDEPSARSLAAAVSQLRGRHLPVILAVADPALARLAKDGADPQVPRAAGWLLDHRRTALAALESAGAVVVDAPAARAGALAVAAYAQLKAHGRL